MMDNHFAAETPAPDEEGIRSALAGAYPLYGEILEAAAGFERDWKLYGRKYGWKLKIHDGEKALLELTVVAGAFRLSLAARERELAALKADPALAGHLALLEGAEGAREGWGIRILVDGREACDRAAALVRALAAMRRAG